MTKKEAMDRAETQVYIYMNRGEIEKRAEDASLQYREIEAKWSRLLSRHWWRKLKEGKAQYEF